MKKIAVFLFTSLALQNIGAQNFIQAYKTRADMVSQTNITNNLTDFENLGVKTTGSTVNANTLNWLKDKYISYGYTTSQIEEDPFTYTTLSGNSISSKNLVITKTGTLYPDKYVIICGHFDTITGPGVSDNGSGTSILLEAARILKDVPTEYSIKFIHFSGEEQGLKGSYHYANNIAYQGDVRNLDIKLVFNIDQVGGLIGNTNNTIKCEKDMGGNTSANNAASSTVTQELATCTGLYSPLQTAISNTYGSDYMPFEAKGYTITGFYEHIKSDNEHTVNDTFANIDPVYVFNVGKAAVGALQHFAVAATTNNLLGTAETAARNSLENSKIYPNPGKDIINIELPDPIRNFSFEITDLPGRSILKTINETKINVSGLENGAYLGVLKAGENTVVRKILIKR